MKFWIKLLSNQIILFILYITYCIFIFNNEKFTSTIIDMSLFSTSLIWLLNWEYYKIQSKNGRSLLFLFITDLFVWPFALIRSSKIILIDEIGEENV